MWPWSARAKGVEFMPTYQYNTVAGTATIEAPDRATALRQLIGRGVAPSGIEEVRGRAAQKAADAAANGSAGPIKVETPKGAAGEAAPASLFARHANVSLQDTAAFIRELATALSA
ncbi:MAG TPA: hypothetical protein VFF65_02355, partial [Phycisphaerales bacterium]|nr:hypothetical protein [Phycisphaerales bacterium]